MSKRTQRHIVGMAVAGVAGYGILWVMGGDFAKATFWLCMFILQELFDQRKKDHVE
jgi:hypothetical protein